MPKFVRVREKHTGHEVSISALAITDNHEVLDEPAVDVYGKPRRPAHSRPPKKRAAPASTPETITSEEL